MKYPIPENEEERIKALHSYHILDTVREEEFDRLVRLALQVCDVPIGLITLVDQDRQWFKSVIGLDTSQTSREVSFCQYTIMKNEMLVVEDAWQDERFVNTPLVTGDPNIRFYAGQALIDPQGFALGSFCIIDRKPRTLSEAQLDIIKILADEAVSNIVARKERERIRKFENLFRLSNDLMWVMNKDGLVLEFNAEFYAFCKVGASDTNISIFNFLDEAGKVLLQDYFDNMRTKPQASYEALPFFIEQKNEPGYLEWNLSWDPTTESVYVVARDITEKIRLNQELVEAKEIAERNAASKDLFLANMSHEIRTPLNAIIGFSTLLADSRLDKDQREHASIIQRASNHLLSIINDILDFSKIESGQISIETIPFSLKETAKDVYDLMKYKAEEKGLLLNCNLDSKLPDYLLGDPTRINQILMNLIGNALKFTEKGQVALDINLKNESVSTCDLEIRISDTGIGIAKEKLETIFERFTQANTDTTRKFGGTGLGLSISRSLVDMIGGTIRVESEIGQGTVFIIDAPFTKANSSEIIDLEKENSPSNGEAKAHLLLVEDNVQNQKLAIQVLNNFHYSVDLAENGQVALDKLAVNHYDLIVMDLQMPVLDGYSTTIHIRQQLKLDIPIIAMTAHSLVGEKEKCMQLGFDDYIPKPFHPKDLQAAIVRLLKKTGQPISIPTDNVSALKNDHQLFNLEYLYETTMNNAAFVQEMIDLFLIQSVSEMASLKAHIDAKDFENIKELAHKMKSSFQFFMIQEEGILAQLEMNGMETKDENNEVLFEQLHEIHKMVIEQLKHVKL